METLRFDLTKPQGPFKPLNATNGGPWHKRHMAVQYRSNLASYRAARIPYSRNHDSAVHTVYGGPYSHDISVIFPDFNANPDDPASYDFPCTDEAVLICLEAGTETFFRLGQTIENQISKHNTRPPKDFHKWAVICEHVIRHYNEGWANGYHLNIRYWEIWNEPDLDLEDSPNKRTWGGTRAQFFDFFETAAKHLKTCFPDLKIGGPALAHRTEWAEAFLQEMRRRGVPLDFFSWHIYCTTPQAIVRRSLEIRALLDKYGYTGAESIVDEWNYVKGWTEEFVYSIRSINGIKGATFALACMCAAQDAPVDMLMYYDTRPSCFNGVFDFYTAEPLKGYYAFYWYGQFYDMAAQVPLEDPVDDIYALCGVGPDGKALAVAAYYTDDDSAADKELAVDLGRPGRYEISLLDSTHDGERMGLTDEIRLTMKAQSAVLIREL